MHRITLPSILLALLVTGCGTLVPISESEPVAAQRAEWSSGADSRPPVVVDIDNTGVADPIYRNRLNPPLLDREDKVRFWNRTLDRPIEIRVKVKVPFDKRAATEEFGQLSDCEDDAGGTFAKCTISLLLQPNSYREISAETRLGLLGEEARIEFEVRFYTETETPANATGYFRQSLPVVVNVSAASVPITGTTIDVRFNDPKTAPRISEGSSLKITAKELPNLKAVRFRLRFDPSSQEHRSYLRGILRKRRQPMSTNVFAPGHDAALIATWVDVLRLKDCGSPHDAVTYDCEVPFDDTSKTAEIRADWLAYATQIEVPVNAAAQLATEQTYIRQLEELMGVRTVAPPRSEDRDLLSLRFVHKDLSSKDYYLRRAPISDEPSKTTISANATLTAAISPLLRPKDPADANSDPIINDEFPYDGDRQHDIAGAGRVTIKQNIRGRADASIDLAIRRGSFGTRDTNVNTPKYQMNLNFMDGSQLQFGRFAFAQPANKIAVNEEGDGVRYNARPLRFLPTTRGTVNLGTPSLAYVVKRRSLTPFKDGDDRNASVLIAQLDRIALPTTIGGVASPFRSLNLIALRGRNQRFSDPHDFETGGGELFYALPQANAISQFSLTTNGSTAFFASRRRSDSTTPGATRSGNVWLTTIGFNLAERTGTTLKPVYGLTISHGRGARDQMDGGVRIPGYVGESAGFAPDLLFLSGFANAVENALDTTDIGPGRGLSNKRYTGVQFAWFDPPPLRNLVQRFVNTRTPVIGQAITLRLHDYSLRESFRGSRDAGREANLEVLIEAPKGIKVTLGAGYFWRGEAMDALIVRRPWTVSLKLSLEP